MTKKEEEKKKKKTTSVIVHVLTGQTTVCPTLMPFTIHVKIAAGAKVSIEVDVEDTVELLKDKLSSKAEVPSVEQRLIHKGKILKNEQKLSSYGEQSPPPRSGACAGVIPLRSIVSSTASCMLPRARKAQNLQYDYL